MASDPTLRLFVHGAGRRGPDAWPTVSACDAEFAPFERGLPIEKQIDLIRDICNGRQVMLFAHSIGAVPAALAVSALDVLGMVLVEPALYDIARGEESIERHIAAVTEARSQALNDNLHGFWGILRPLMFGGSIDNERWNSEQPVAQHWSQTNLPWGHGVRPEVLDRVRALVVTGGWNDEYELIAQRLSSRGAEHVVLTGAGHRAQDLPAFSDVVRRFERTLNLRPPN